MKPRANFKFNNGNLALLCSNCSIIMKVGYEFSVHEQLACKEIKYLAPQYCDKCLIEKNKTDENIQ